jgi:ligand-binding sensor protein
MSLMKEKKLQKENLLLMNFITFCKLKRFYLFCSLVPSDKKHTSFTSPSQTVNGLELNRGPSKDASYQVSGHLTKQFQRRFF